MTVQAKAFCDGIPVYCSHDEIVDIMKVIPNPKNPNKHPSGQIEILSKVIKGQGWRKPITVSKRSGFIVSGHGRLQAALLMGADKVPVDYQDYANEAEEYADLVADNRISELSSVDEDMLIELLNEINETDIDVMMTGYDYHEIDDLLQEMETLNVPGSFDADYSHGSSDTFHANTTTPQNDNDFSEPDYEDTLEKRKANTGELDLNDFSEENYQHQCPKCKFMW